MQMTCYCYRIPFEEERLGSEWTFQITVFQPSLLGLFGLIPSASDIRDLSWPFVTFPVFCDASSHHNCCLPTPSLKLFSTFFWQWHLNHSIYFNSIFTQSKRDPVLGGRWRLERTKSMWSYPANLALPSMQDVALACVANAPDSVFNWKQPEQSSH